MFAQRSREASKELVNLLTQCLEEMGIESASSDSSSSSSAPADSDNVREKSVQEILAEEIAQTKGNRFKASSQPFVTLQTGIKGVIIAKICRKDVGPCALIDAILARVTRDKQPVSRYIARIIPLEKLFFPDTESLQLNVRQLMRGLYPGATFKPDVILAAAAPAEDEGAEPEPGKRVAETGPAAGEEPDPKKVRVETTASDFPSSSDSNNSTPDFMTYSVFFRSRCCERLSKTTVVETVNAEMPSFAKIDFRAPQVPALATVSNIYLSACLAAPLAGVGSALSAH